MCPKQSRKKTTIFVRIMLRLMIPLFLLATVISAVQLVNQVQAMNRYYKVEGRLVFQSMQQFLAKALKDPALTAAPEELQRRISGLLNFEQEIRFQIFDLYNDKTLFEDQRPWSTFDQKAGERSLYLKKEEGKPYFIHVNKQKKELVAYIPFLDAGNPQIWIARVHYPLAQINDVLHGSRGILITLISLILFTGFFIGNSLAKSIVKPIQTLNRATQAIMEGRLGKRVEIKTGDELQTLADAFNHMSQALVGMRSSAEDSNPLSGLPGNNGIKKNLQRRITSRQKFVVFHTDLDRFKTFNDKYGLAKGDEAITRTAEVLKAAVKAKGTKDDFIGHQGGDDFMVICRVQNAKAVAEEILTRFDRDVVKPVYPKEDYERGYTVALDRRAMAERGDNQAVEKRFPLLGLSLAGISNAKKDFVSYDDVLKRAIPVKKSVKAVVESSYEIQE